jgi:integral membrane protein
VRGFLLRYRVMAYVVGTLLAILVLVGVPLKYAATEGSDAQQVGEWITTWLGTAHGFLYMIFLVTAAMLARKARFPIGFSVLILVLGTVPILSFVGERLATGRVRREHAAELDGRSSADADGDAASESGAGTNSAPDVAASD